METHQKETASFGGWQGKILKVDLTKGNVWEEELEETLMVDYVGGAGLNAKLLYDAVKDNPHLDPLSPENPLIFGFGPLVGTLFPCCSRFTVTAKSPLTGIFGDSNGGSFFPARVKQAGYDHIFITGKAETPVALFIEKGKVPKLVDAKEMWGLDAIETDEYIAEKYGNSESARIGPAGENLVKYANIISGRTRIGSNGRAGMGCVMGSKRLKAIIVKATGAVQPAQSEPFEALTKQYWDLFGKGPATFPYKEFGSFMLIHQLKSETGINNHQEDITPELMENYDINDFVETYKTGQVSCYRCPIACTQKWKIKNGPFSGEEGGKVEFGHYNHLGPLLGIFDFPSLFHMSNLTNRLGLDCIQFGWNMAMAMECFQRGLLPLETTDGLKLEWGDVELVSAMIEKVAKREGLGDILAEAMPDVIRALGEACGPYGFHTKGMSFAYSCESAVAMGLASSVGTRGADHLKGHPFSGIIGLEEMLEKIFGKNVPSEINDSASPVAKGRVVWWHENYKMLMDSLGLCFIPAVAVSVYGDPHMLFKEMGEIYEAATGKDPNLLFQSAERAYQMERCYNALLGIDRESDVRHGTRRGQKDLINHPGMLDEYYNYRGCSNQGMPTRKRLLELGLEAVTQDLAASGKLSDVECPAIDELLPEAAKKE